MTWVRDHSDGSGNTDAIASDESIGYIVQGFSGTQVRTNPGSVLGGDTGSEPLPALGSPHPDIPGLKLDRYSTRDDGVICRVTGIYSTNGSGRLPPPVGPLPANRFMYSRETFDWELPYAVREPQELETPGGTTTVLAWIPKVWKIAQELQVRQYAVRVDPEDIDAANAAASAQDRKLHMLGGSQWRFFAAKDITYLADTDEYELQYKWVQDPGWILPNTVNFAGFVFPTLQTVGGADYTRPPYHIFAPLKRQTDLITAPDFPSALYAEVDDDGWQSLYGLT